MKHTLPLLTGLLLLAATHTAQAANVTFGTGGNQFGIEFVDIGNANNADDTTGWPNPVGKVEYDYSISKYEISQNMIDAATASGLTGVTAGAHAGDKPAADVSWYEAAKFVNWLSTSSMGSAAYKFDGSGNFQLWGAGDTLDYDASNRYRSLRASYWLPSMDEWYKAAYYDGDTDTYYDYATGSDTAPTSTASGTAAGTAVYREVVNSIPVGPVVPADIDLAGGPSPYGTVGQSGNVWEWEETAFDRGNNSTAENRDIRGGAWFDHVGYLRSGTHLKNVPSFEHSSVGFRVAGASVVPEPSRTLLGVVGLCSVLLRRRRR